MLEVNAGTGPRVLAFAAREAPDTHGRVPDLIMAALEFFLVAESVAVDQTTGQISVFNIIEDVRALVLPGMIPQATAICAWNMAPEDVGQDFQVIFRVTPPGEAPRDHATNFTGASPRQRMITRLIQLLVTAPGALVFEVLLNGQHQASHTVTVTLLDPAMAAVQA